MRWFTILLASGGLSITGLGAVSTRASASSAPPNAPGPVGVFHRGPDIWVVTRDATLVRHVTVAGDVRQVVQPAPGTIVAVGDGWLAVVTLADGSVSTHQLDTTELGVLADGDRLAVLGVSTAEPGVDYVVAPPVTAVGVVDLLTGRTVALTDGSLQGLQVGERSGSYQFFRRGGTFDTVAAMRLDVTEARVVQAARDATVDDGGTRLAYSSLAGLFVTDGLSAPTRLGEVVKGVRAWVDDRVMVDMADAAVLVGLDGSVVPIRSSLRFGWSPGHAVFTSGTGPTTWVRVLRSGDVMALDELRGMRTVDDNADEVLWFVNLDEPAPFGGSPLKILDLATNTVADVRGTIRQLVGLAESGSGHSDDGRLRWGAYTLGTGHAGLALAWGDGTVDTLDLVGTPVAAAADERYLLAMTVGGPSVIALGGPGGGATITPVNGLGRVDPVDGLRWVATT